MSRPRSAEDPIALPLLATPVPAQAVPAALAEQRVVAGAPAGQVVARRAFLGSLRF